eukprot:Gb_05849 [translate_table: standard]
MDYERVDKNQVGVASSTKLRSLPLDLQTGSKNVEVDKLALVECTKGSFSSGNVNCEGVQGFYSSKENTCAIQHEAGHSLETTLSGELSLTAPPFDEVADLELAAQNLASFKDVYLKVQNFPKPISAQLVNPGNCNFVQAMRPFEDDGFDYASGYDNGSTSSFDFHKGDRTFHRSVLGSLSKPAPSKWDDAEKWLVSLSSGDSHIKNKSKVGPGQFQAISAYTSRKVSINSQTGHQLGIVKSVSPNASGLSDKTTLYGRGLNQDEGETKKIDSKFAFVQKGAHAATANFNDSLDSYALNPDLVNLKEVNDAEAFLKTSLRHEKPLADSAIETFSPAVVLSKHDPLLSLHGTASYIPPPSNARSVSMRDMGTEMTPITSHDPSRTGTPIRATTPMIRSPVSSPPSTPGRAAPASSPMEATENELEYQEGLRNPEQLEKELHMKTRQEIMVLGAQLGKANIAAWASKGEEENDASKSLNTTDLEEVKKNIWEARAAAWEEAEQAKYMARYKREEVKIQAWENHQKAKADAEMRRLEVKVERMKSHAHEKLLNKLAAARRQAEEKRATAEAKNGEQTVKTKQRADYIRRTGRMRTSFLLCGFCC